VHGATYALVDERGLATVYDDHRTDQQYSTDVLGAEMRRFIADAAGQGRPFFALWTPYASHAEIPSLRPEPAARHYLFYRDLSPWRPLNFNELDVADKPRHIQDLMLGSFGLVIFTDAIRRRAYESLLAVDENLSMLLDDLVQLGIDDNTVIIVTSDNGVSWGEHRAFSQTKEYPYEECLRVPMLVRDPRAGGSAVVRDAVVLNIDVAPTVAELAGVVPPVATDGVSFAPWLESVAPAQWRDDFLLEHWRSARDDRLDYTANMSDGDQVRLLYGDARVHPRASVLFEFDDGSGVAVGAVAVPIGNDADATFAQLGALIPTLVPFTSPSHSRAFNQLQVVDDSPDHVGVYWFIERDQGHVIDHPYGLGDYYGVRDVRGGFTYVEHESGEIELYDLTVDPAQLENKASDPTYAGTRERLANRLNELLQ
jgi:arylsulfatase A-like enzyme